jgi:hypothetical protein
MFASGLLSRSLIRKPRLDSSRILSRWNCGETGRFRHTDQDIPA